MGGDDRFLNYSTLVNGLSTIREFDFGKGEIVYAQNISSPRWCARACLSTLRSVGSCTTWLLCQMTMQDSMVQHSIIVQTVVLKQRVWT